MSRRAERDDADLLALCRQRPGSFVPRHLRTAARRLGRRGRIRLQCVNHYRDRIYVGRRLQAWPPEVSNA